MKQFPKNARVCFIGDSLTAQSQVFSRVVDHYCKYLPERSIRFFNCGTSGGTYRAAIDFFQSDILVHKPTHAVVAYGINDSRRGSLPVEKSEKRSETLHSAFEKYKNNLAECCELLKKNGVEVILCTPAPYDEYSDKDTPALKGGYALMLGYAAFVREYAKENGYELCDYNAYVSKCLETDTASLYNPDRVHPNPHGYYIMAKCFLEGQGFVADEEAPIPEYMSEWFSTVRRLRIVQSAEYMVIKDHGMPTEEKLAMMQKRIDEENWGYPAHEPFIRGFVNDKPQEEELRQKENELYETVISKFYVNNK